MKIILSLGFFLSYLFAFGVDPSSLTVSDDIKRLTITIEGSPLNSLYNLYLDTDHNTATGVDDSNWTPMGADFLVQNGNLFESNGAGGWTFIGASALSITEDLVSSPNTRVIEINREALTPLFSTGEMISVGFLNLTAGFAVDGQIPASGGPFTDYIITKNYIADLQTLSISDDASQINVTIDGSSINGFYSLYLNTDNNITTGNHDGNWSANIGAEYLVQNGNLFEDDGAGGWIFLGATGLGVSEDLDSELNTRTISIARTELVALSISNTIRAGYINLTAGFANDGQLPASADPFISHIIINTGATSFVWDGSTSTDWATASNWDGNAVPASLSNVTIPNVANDPVITSDAAVNDLILNASATITVTSNGLAIHGDFTMNGNINIASGASLLPLGSISGSGEATINRNPTFGVSDGQYSVIGSPITTGSTSILGDIVYSYNEDENYGIDGNSRFDLEATPIIMTSGDAYFSANTGNISFVGIPNSGNIDKSLVYDVAGDGGASNAGYNLVSNPYTAAISYAKLMAGNADIDGTIYLWDDGGSDQGTRSNSDYITVSSIGATGGSARSGDWDGNIRSTQGFFVKATSAGTAHFTPSMMVTDNNSEGGFFREENPTVLRFALSSENAYSDILIGLTMATEGYDRTLDAYKLKGNKTLQLYSRMQESIMAIQAFPELVDERAVGLGFDTAEGGTYTFELIDPALYRFEVYLKDKLLDKVINLTENNNYSFQSSIVNNSDRFSLIFATNSILNIDVKSKVNQMIVYTEGNDLNVSMSDNISNATVNIYNLKGTLVQQVTQVNFTDTKWSIPFDGQGLYIITVQAEGKMFAKKFIN